MGYFVDKIVVGELQTNCYILADTGTNRCAIIDPGADYKKIKAHIDKKKLAPIFIINTHAHPDHIGDNDKFNLPVYIHKDDAKFSLEIEEPPDKLLNDADEIQLGSLVLRVIHTPGHTPGGICLLCSNLLFSGDTLFASGVGRTGLPYGNEAQIINSINKKLLVLPEDIKVYPGHGPPTTIGKEKAGNPWI